MTCVLLIAWTDFNSGFIHEQYVILISCDLYSCRYNCSHCYYVLWESSLWSHFNRASCKNFRNAVYDACLAIVPSDEFLPQMLILDLSLYIYSLGHFETLFWKYFFVGLAGSCALEIPYRKKGNDLFWMF